MHDINPDAIAIIGMACRFPGAADVARFWRNLRDGVESVQVFRRDELAARGVPAALLDDPQHVPAGAVLDGIELFDADFFGFTPREAELTDPQHRVFLECAWESLEDSGHDPERFDGRIGVYAGAGLSTYLVHHLLPRPDLLRSAGALPLQLGNNKDYVPLRVSYKLRLRGPSVAVNTACSSSLVAVHIACQALLDRQCDIALAGGVGIQVPQDCGYLHAPNGILSPDGHCRAFDAAAQGTVSGNGAGIVVLRRLADAVAHGDAIRAVIIGSAVNNDGGQKVGFTAPSVEGQAEVIAEALAMARVEASAIGYVEAHGTGTPLGDPIEVRALTRAFRASTDAIGTCALGSVKSNIGHLDEAAGIAGLIKTVLAVQHGEIPPSLHCTEPNPALDLAASPFHVPARLGAWPRMGGPRRAGVSSFGLGGTNAHVVLQEAPPAPAEAGTARAWQLLLLSARTPQGLAAQRERLAAHLRAHPSAVLADVAHTLCEGRKDFAHRTAVLCRDAGEALQALDAPAPAVHVAPAAPRPVVFMFPGQGSPYPGMGQGLYRAEPVYREWIARCADRLKPVLGLDLREVLDPRPDQAEAAALRLARTEVAQPALFAVELALAHLLAQWDIRPAAMIGHSLGEYVAACLAGIWSWEDALDLVAERGRLMQAQPAGAMLAVELPEADLRPLLGGGLALAAVNAPGATVAAGEPEEVAALQSRLEARGITCRRLATAHAFHSAAMEPVIEPFLARLRRVRFAAPTLPFVSTLTGQWIGASEATDPQYWARHLRRTVRFADGMALLAARPGQAYLEVGPGTALSALARRRAAGAADPAVAAMRHRQDPGDDVKCLLDAVGSLWLAGAWRKSGALHAGEVRRRVALPTYPFERRRYWVDPVPAAAQATPEAAPAAIQGWFHVPSWRTRALAPAPLRALPAEAGWLVFADPHGLGDAIAKRLRAAGQRVVEVVAATEGSACIGTERHAVDPRRPGDLDRLFEALAGAAFTPRHVVHLWSWSPTVGDGGPAARWDQAQALGFDHLLRLVQAAARHGLAQDLVLDVLSSGMQQVRGHDALPCPERATLLGPMRVAPLECPGLRCRSIDLDLAPPGDGDLDLLLDELQREPAAPVLALRDGALWEQTFAPLPPAAPAPQCLREGATVLVTGGLGSMGLAFARCLWQDLHARLVLVGRTGLPPQDQWDAWLEGSAPCTFEVEPLHALEAAARSEEPLLDIDAPAPLQAQLQAFCAALAGRVLAEAGVRLDTGSRHSHEALHQALRTVPRLRGFLGVLLGALEAEGIVQAGPHGVVVQDATRLRQPDELRPGIVAQAPRLQGLLDLAEGCAARSLEALSGAVPSITVLYPDGTAAWMDACRRDVPPYAWDGVYVRTAARRAAELAAQAGTRPLRILEVGGGGGTLTHAVLAALRERLGDGPYPIEYCFTDLGPSLVRRAEQEAAAAGLHFMRFGTLDISRDPGPQGHADGSADLVLGYNVVHATPRLDETLAHLGRLLAPGGRLMLVETTRLRRWDEMVWGLTEGWWHFEGDPRRPGGSPLLALDAWETLLRDHGFDAVAACPQDPGTRLAADAGLVVGRKPARPALHEPIRTAIATVREIRQAGGEVLVLQADLADPAALRAALAQARQRFGRIDAVVHTAGVLGQGLLHTRSGAATAPALAGKARGLLVLDELLQAQDPPPARLLLCSSLAAVAPIAGQVDYCAANAFLDAYAAHRNAAGGGHRAAVSVGWGFWQALGMIEQAHLPEAQRQELLQSLQQPGRAQAGVAVFRHLLGHATPPHVLVTPDPLVASGPAHPWLDRQPLDLAGAHAWVARFDSRDWVLHEHRPFGHAVLPGTAYLELACAALVQQGGAWRPMQLDNVYFLLPLVVDDAAQVELRTVLTPRGEGFEFVVASRAAADADEWLEHARGEIAWLATPAPEPVALAGIADRCAAQDLPLATEAPLARRVRGFEPHWRCFERVRIGQGEGLAALRLAPAFAGEAASFTLHPALADMATGFLSIADGVERGVPFGYRRVRIWQPLGAALHSHVRAAASRGPAERSYDATVVDDHGAVRLDVAGFTMREPAAAPAAPAAPDGGNHRVEIGRPGGLTTLCVRAAQRRPPGPGEVEIEVAATGLNFIEVLYALGLLPEPVGGEAAFGIECAGHIAAIGPGVQGFAPGDAVFGFAPAALARFATTRADAIAFVPPGLGLEQAAGLAAAYTTAFHALVTRGQLRRGERVLIHAAAGGVGLAAVHVARWRGAKVYATAGSPAKRDYLKSLGITQVWDSRSLDFAAGVRDATRGLGVDVVLNSLGGDFIAASLGVLARHGRFLELGKRDILRNTALGLGAFERHLSFTAIDVGTDLPDFTNLWRKVVRGICRGSLPPLPVRSFPIASVADAFEHMAQAQHIGKVVIATGPVDAMPEQPLRRRGRPFEEILGRSAQTAAAPASPPLPPQPRSAGHQRPALAAAYRAPSGAVEAAVVSIWEDLLGLSGIGADDNFFELRGDSLLAAQVTSRLHAAFQLKLPLSSVFEHPTPAGLALRIEQLRQSARELSTAPPVRHGHGEVEHEL